MNLYKIVFILLLHFCNSIQVKVKNTGIIKLELNAERETGVWTALGYNGTQRLLLPAGVPGGIYSDLEASGLLNSKIYHDYNDMESKWVGRTNWTFTRKFFVKQQLLAKKKVVLICEGLDTVGMVYVNEKLVGKAKNMFVRYIFDIRSVLQPGLNSIRISFTSPVEYAFQQYQRHEALYGYPVTPEKLVPEYRGENKAQMIRKMQSSFSWDWGPSYASSGIWKDIYIEAFDGAVIRDVLMFSSPNQTIPDGTDATLWRLTGKVYFDVASIVEQGALIFQFVTRKEIIVRLPVRLSLKSADQPKYISMTVPGSMVDLWWPNGYGHQPLYHCRITYVSDEAEETSASRLRIGFRTVELIQDFVNVTNPIWGREFYFKVNGHKIYSKGSNSIPMHVLPEKVTKEHTKWLLDNAKSLHFNMIRVWGGGVYESDYFYNLADELGILIWQDFMFACAMYPATDAFLLNVIDEIETQVKRLQYHPSLAIWAANNENEAALEGNWYQTSSNFNIYKKDFIKLYVDTIIANVSRIDPSRHCLSSSPTNGIETQEEGWVASNPGDNRYGDVHHYDYYGDVWNGIAVNRPARFTSEYGLQSFPYIETIAKITSNLDEWTWHSAMAEHRQRHPNGQKEISSQIQRHLPFPTHFNSSNAFPAMVYMSQIAQAVGQKTQTEYYRRLMDKFNEVVGTGHNMGALYWQLNDIWEGCSWASFEVNGRWKMFAYYMQRAFHPVLPSIYKTTNGDSIIELISDDLRPFKGEMRTRVFGLDSLQPLLDERRPVTASFLTSNEVHRISRSVLEQIECGDESTSEAPKRTCLVYVTLPKAPDNFVFLQYPRTIGHIKDPQLQVTYYEASPDLQKFTITLNVKNVALFVFINLKNHTYGRFSDNGFIMVEHQKNVTYISREPMSLTTFMSQLDIISLYNVTQL